MSAAPAAGACDHGARRLSVVQLLPALDSGGVERGTLEVARHLVRHGHASLVISAGGRMAAQLREEGSEHLQWDIGRKHPAVLMWIPKLRALLAERRPDILHMRSRLPAWIGWHAWRRLDPRTRPRLVTTVHGTYTPGRYSSVMTRGERVIAVSHTVRDHVLTHYPDVDPARIRVIWRGVDGQAYPYGYRPPPDWLERWRAEQPRLADHYVVTLPARLTRWKGQEHFIEVIAALRAGGVPVHGLMVGGAHRRRRSFARELARRIHDRGLGDAITLLGHRADLREILALSDAVVSLSTDPEAFGRTTVEALAMGRPVAGYDHGGVGEQLHAVFPEGAVAPGDHAAVAERLALWYRQPPRVPDHNPFTLDRMLDATLDVYRELADAPR